MHELTALRLVELSEEIEKYENMLTILKNNYNDLTRRVGHEVIKCQVCGGKGYLYKKEQYGTGKKYCICNSGKLVVKIKKEEISNV